MGVRDERPETGPDDPGNKGIRDYLVNFFVLWYYKCNYIRYKGVIEMIKISCERNRLAGWEKLKYAKAIRVIVRELKEFQKAIEEERVVEVDYLIIMK